MQSTLKRATTLPAQLRKSKSGVSAQDLIRLPKATVKSGVLRKKSPSIIHKAWPRRFIILLHDSVYIYGDETSKSPNATLPLYGYKQVVRTESAVHDWCFTLVPVQDLTSIKPKSFSCVSDQERCEWMTAIRNEMFSINGFDRLGAVPEQKLRAMSPGEPALEAVYKTIEEPVPVARLSHAGNSSESEDEYYDSSSNDGDSESFSKNDKPEQQARNKKSPTSDKNIKLPPFPPQKPSPASPTSPTPKSSPAPTSKPAPAVPSKPVPKLPLSAPIDPAPKPSPSPPCDPPPKSPAPKPSPSPPCDPPPKSPAPRRIQSSSLSPNSAETQPPRYSALVESEKSDYVNVESPESLYEYPNDNPVGSLENQCTVRDDKSDRDDLIRMLQAKQVSGTYLIRKSRQGGDNVIAYLTMNGRVVEYKVYSSDSGFSLDKAKYFGDVEELLRHYTHQEPLPQSNNFLRFGFNSVQ